MRHRFSKRASMMMMMLFSLVIINSLHQTCGDASEGWKMEKYVLSIHSGTGVDVQNFFLRHKLCAQKDRCPSDLGCGMLRSWCLVKLPYESNEFPDYMGELHWVDAPLLADVKVDGKAGMDYWVETFEALNGQMARFNAFMHNKLQLYTKDLAPFVASFAKYKVPTLMRRSQDSEGATVVHVGFAIAGRIYELVGPASSFPESLPEPWAPEEFPASHMLVQPLSQLRTASLRINISTDTMMVGIGITHHAPQRGGAMEMLYGHLQNFTGSQVQTTVQDTSCTVVEMQWNSMPGLAIRYVGSEAWSGTATLEEYDSYAAANHGNFTSGRPFGRVWDHILDQHLGLWYGGPEGECEAKATAVRGALQLAGLPVGERDEPDAHLMYTGYGGPMTWEYQFQHCNAGHPEAGTECACNPLNHPNGDGSCPRNHTDGTLWCLKG